MADTVPAMLEPGEYVIRKDAAEEIGIDNLNMLNNVDRSSQMYMNHGGLVPQLQHGHSAIDELLAINTLSNQANVDMTRQSSMMNQGGELISKGPMKRKGDMYSRESIYKFPTDDGDRFYSGVNRSDRKQSILNNTFSEKALLDAISKMQSSPQDSISSGNVEGYFDKKGLSKFLPFNQGGEGKVPQAPDPLQIDARMRGEFKNMGTIGAVDSNKYYSNLLNEAMKDREMLEKASFLEGYAPSEEKIEQDIFKALDYFSRKHKASPKVQGYNNGGTVGYGDQTSNVMTLEDIYAQYGQRPDDASGFQEYDVSREGGALADYSRQVSGLQQQGMGMIGKATQQAQGMGGGFAGFGGRQSAIDQTRTQAQRGYQAGVDQAQQNKFETIRSMREGYQADIIGQLAQEESVEGTSSVNNPNAVPVGATGWSAPTSPNNGESYVFEGKTYKWDGTEWLTANQYDEEMFDNYYNDGI